MVEHDEAAINAALNLNGFAPDTHQRTDAGNSPAPDTSGRFNSASTR
ncbi:MULTISPECIES: hypothetical protein [unclassified Streptomyces]